MRSILPLSILFLLFVPFLHAEPEFPLTADSQPLPNVPKGTILKDNYTAKEGSVFPGTQRDYQIYLPAGFDKTRPAAFMVFQDGVIYQAPVVFDNLIAKKDIPPLVGIFIKPGVVPAANDNALPRFNRSYEYDSVTPTYSQFLLDEFLPAIEAKHGLKLSTDPNHAAISGNSSGGICAFMAAWHRPDRFRRVFTGVGTYVGIHGADQLPVLVRKFEPKPLRVFLQSGTGDNNLYCGDWWMANQMMERSLTWAGYDVNHAWGEGGHNAKHASQIFPDVMRWLWRDWQTNIEIKANPKGESKWKGYEVVGDGVWHPLQLPSANDAAALRMHHMAANQNGDVFFAHEFPKPVWRHGPDGHVNSYAPGVRGAHKLWSIACDKSGLPVVCVSGGEGIVRIGEIDNAGVMNRPSRCSEGLMAFGGGDITLLTGMGHKQDDHEPFAEGDHASVMLLDQNRTQQHSIFLPAASIISGICLSPDQTQIYLAQRDNSFITSVLIKTRPTPPDDPFAAGQKDGTEPALAEAQRFGELEGSKPETGGLCVDTNGWLYVATSLGIQVCDQAGRVNFIIPTPKQPYDVCFGGKDLSELFIACGDTIYKRPTKAKGVVSGQQPPIKPAPPKL
jgi:enterochelin esterase-like enzyme